MLKVPTKEKIRQLAELHIHRYSTLLGHPNARLDECIHYLNIWKSIKVKDDYHSLTKEEKNEVRDALDDEEC